jgi:hypothetical protein
LVEKQSAKRRVFVEMSEPEYFVMRQAVAA